MMEDEWLIIKHNNTSLTIFPGQKFNSNEKSITTKFDLNRYVRIKLKLIDEIYEQYQMKEKGQFC